MAMTQKVTHSDIERLARQAIKDTKKPTLDLIKNGIPFRPALWYILVQPIEPRLISDGGIYTPDISQEAEEWAITVGKVIKCGPAAFEGKTQSGIELKNFLPGIQCAEQLIGKFVIYQLHTGMDLKLRNSDIKVKVMKITDLLGDSEDPNAWKFYI